MWSSSSFAVLISVLCALSSYCTTTSVAKHADEVCFDGVSCLDDTEDHHTVVIPASGFIHADSLSTQKTTTTEKLMIRVLKKHHEPPLCPVVSFVNPPKPNASPLVGANRFQLLTTRMYNDHFVWSNGVEFISFIKHEHGHNGNWLLGPEPGVDSGYVYMESSQSALSPITYDNHDHFPYKWKWLQHGKWEDQPNMRMICVDDEQEDRQALTHFYEVEYFPPSQTTDEFSPQHTILLLNINLDNYAMDNTGLMSTLFASSSKCAGHDDEEEDDEEDNKSGVKLAPACQSGSNSKVHALLDKETMKFIALENIQVVTSVGEVTALKSKLGQQFKGVLVNVEHSHFAWRLTYRKLHMDDVTLSHSSNHKGKKQKKQEKGDEKEISIELNNEGVLNKEYQVEEAHKEEDVQSHQQSLLDMLHNVKVGDYLWSWQSQFIDSAVDLEQHQWGSKEHIQEYVLQCYARHNDVLIFRLFHSDRSVNMKQSMLSRDIDFFTLRLSDIDDHEDKVLIGRYQNVDYRVHHMLYIGSNALDMIKDYVFEKEGKLANMSSCYMYHAAYSLPQPFLYANEILCVLMGAKPLTMIQYQSPSEHQWKFPLVSDLVNAISAMKTMFGQDFSFDFEVFRDHHQDETLIIYHVNHQSHMEALLPQFEAQALHPLPFVEEFDDPELKVKAARDRVYNSAFNGFVLGYPARFVLSYCETLGDYSLVSLEEKRELVEYAKQDYISRFQQLYEIRLGLNPVISDEHLKVMHTLMGNK